MVFLGLHPVFLEGRRRISFSDHVGIRTGHFLVENRTRDRLPSIAEFKTGGLLLGRKTGQITKPKHMITMLISQFDVYILT